MGATMRQQLDAIAGAYEHQEREIMALQQVIMRLIREDNDCIGAPCKAYAEHPAPWHAELCGCACEARDIYVDFLRVLDAEANA